MRPSIVTNAARVSVPYGWNSPALTPLTQPALAAASMDVLAQ